VKQSATKLWGIHWHLYPCRNDWRGRPLICKNFPEAQIAKLRLL